MRVISINALVKDIINSQVQNDLNDEGRKTASFDALGAQTLPRAF